VGEREGIMNFNNCCELEALKVEAMGMVAENDYRARLGQSPAFSEDSFAILAAKIRALKD